MNPVVSSALVLLLVYPLVAQSEYDYAPKSADFPILLKEGRSVSDFLPRGFEIVKRVDGDLNSDGLDDTALLIIGRSDRFVYKTQWVTHDLNPRVIFVLLRKSSGRLQLAAHSNRFIIARPDPSYSEPFQDMSIKDGILNLKMELWQSAGSWSATNASYKFRYQMRKFVLIGADREDYMRNSRNVTSVSYNFLTKRAKVVDGIRRGLEAPEGEKTASRITWKLIRTKQVPTLETIGPAFSWAISRDEYI